MDIKFITSTNNWFDKDKAGVVGAVYFDKHDKWKKRIKVDELPYYRSEMLYRTRKGKYIICYMNEPYREENNETFFLETEIEAAAWCLKYNYELSEDLKQYLDEMEI